MPRRCAASAGGIRDRGSVAALPAPAPLAHPPAQAFRPSWLRCERVKQRVITTGQPASEDRNIALERIMQNLISTERHRPQWLANRPPCSARPLVPKSSTTARSGTRTRRLPGSRKRSTSWPAPSHRRHAARRRTRVPALGLRQYAARPGPAPRPRHRQDRA